MCQRIQEGGSQSNNILEFETFYFEKEYGKIQLKRSQKYFPQIQGQVSQLKRVNFDVHTGKNVQLYVETVTFDEIFQQYILTQIDFFLRWAVVPELFTLRIKRGEKLYEKGEWNKKFFKEAETNKTAVNFIATFHENIIL